MQKLAVIGTMAFLLLTFTATVFAETIYKYSEGTCPGGGEWWSVTRYEDGEPTYMQGVNCKGQKYFRPLRAITATSNPTMGMTPTHSGSCTNATIPSGWESVIQYDSNHDPVWMGGQDCDGRYWIVTDFTETEGGTTQ